jgi:hypothetical protein
VGIYEAGQQSGLGQVNRGRARGNLGGCCIADTLDTIAVNDNHLVAARRGGLAID